MKSFDVITFGSNTIDLFVETGLAEVNKGQERLIAYPVGLKILVKDLHVETGGFEHSTH